MCENKWRRYLRYLICVLIGLAIGLLVRSGGGSEVICGALNARYMVDDMEVQLEDGMCRLPFGQDDTMLASVNFLPIKGELNGDGKDDAAVILLIRTPDGGFYQYAAAAIVKGKSVEGTNGVFLGQDSTVTELAIEDAMIWISLEQYTDAGLTQTQKQLTLRDGMLVEIG